MTTSSERKQAAAKVADEERRHTERYPVNLNAVSHQADGSAIACEIKNVCLSGMYISFSQTLGTNTGAIPAVGEPLKLECFIPADNTIQRVMLTTKVVRHYAGGAGIAFVDPEPATIAILRAYIESHASQKQQHILADAAPRSGTNKSTRNAKTLLNDCARIFTGQAGSLLKPFLAKIDDEMTAAAQKAGSNTEQNEYFDAIGTLARQRRTLQETFKKAVIKELNTYTRRKRNDASATVSADTAELTLMADDSLESWLAVKNITNQTRNRHQRLINDLEARLSTLCRKNIDVSNNPFDPGIYAHAFDSALAQLDLNHRAKLLCFSVFSSAAAEPLGKVYSAAVDFLDQNGIEPASPGRMNKADAETPTHTSATSAAASEAGATDPDMNQTTTQSTSAPTAGNGPAPARAEQPSIYNLVSELRQLKAQIRNTSPRGDAMAIDIGEDDTPAAEFSTDEILGALSTLQQGMPAVSHSDISNLESRTAEILKKLGQDGDATKRIAPKHSNIMDVTGNLFETLLHDVLIADSVRQWINKLEIPVLKLALQDDSVFTDKNHAARQVLNNIAQLEGYTTVNDNGEKNAIWNKIDTLLERIIANIDSDPDIFQTALKEVNALVKIQERAFLENVEEVIRACAASDTSATDTSVISPSARDDLQAWEKQALRLQPGDWLNFLNTTSGIQRQRLAWISANRYRYVFVNRKGLKEATLTFDQLAQRLREGTIIPLGSDDDPALDRAQQSMLDRLHKQLLFESSHDQLTGLLNRREFEHRLDSRLHELGKQRLQDVLCYLDINQYNVINSTYGHDAGDKLLTDMANLLLRSSNGMGQLARVSHDAYAILFEQQTVTDVRNFIQQQINLLKDFRFHWEEQELSLSINTGLVPLSDYTASAAELLRIAELCCTAAKDKGGNQIHIYQQDDNEASQQHSVIHHALQIDKSISNHNIELLKQKIVPIQPEDSDRPYHSEIIIRVKDDNGKPLPTQDFILAAETHNSITTLDRWVVSSTIAWMQQHPDAMQDIGGFAINLSGRSLNDADFLDFIHRSVTEANIPSDWICFEITETADIDNLSDAAEFIRKIKETGCHFSLDDFGSGLSSYTYLKSLPVDYLKIDGTFVRNMHENANDYAVVKSICDIGHFMGKKIIAEFVENEQILNLLRELGIDYAQGWGIEKPQPLL